MDEDKKNAPLTQELNERTELGIRLLIYACSDIQKIRTACNVAIVLSGLSVGFWLGALIKSAIR